MSCVRENVVCSDAAEFRDDTEFKSPRSIHFFIFLQLLLASSTIYVFINPARSPLQARSVAHFSVAFILSAGYVL